VTINAGVERKPVVEGARLVRTRVDGHNNNFRISIKLIGILHRGSALQSVNRESMLAQCINQVSWTGRLLLSIPDWTCTESKRSEYAQIIVLCDTELIVRKINSQRLIKLASTAMLAESRKRGPLRS